jgi:hypothetical protein
VKGWKKIYQAKGHQKQAGVAILISDKVDFKLTLIKRDKEGHVTLIKGEMHQKEITIINLYSLNVSAPTFIKHTLKDLKAFIDSNYKPLKKEFEEDYRRWKDLPCSCIGRLSIVKMARPPPSLPGTTCSALFSNFVEEKT